MGVCLFVASGLSFNVDDYLNNSPFKPASVFRKGEIPPKDNPQRQARSDSGFVVLVGQSDEPGIVGQIGQAAEFLAKHVKELKRLRAFGVDNMLLDFGIQSSGQLQQSAYLPPEFISALASLGLGLVFSAVRFPEG